ncbi:hypothetical protein BY458DRAFT_489284 [Sporodiniella umbellata]|nr:hypothetical protein BY458DRAFT_489284 [Sporodiniella umbellata]
MSNYAKDLASFANLEYPPRILFLISSTVAFTFKRIIESFLIYSSAILKIRLKLESANISKTTQSSYKNSKSIISVRFIFQLNKFLWPADDLRLYCGCMIVFGFRAMATQKIQSLNRPFENIQKFRLKEL